MKRYLSTREGRLPASAFSSIPFTVMKNDVDGRSFTVAIHDRKHVWISIEKARKVYADSQYKLDEEFEEVSEEDDEYFGEFSESESDSENYDSGESSESESDDVEDVSNDDLENDDADSTEHVVDIDKCEVCDQGGFLIVCDRCERCYHLFCASLSDVPDGNFVCGECKDLQPSSHDFDRILNPVVRQELRNIIQYSSISSISHTLIRKMNSNSSSVVRKAIERVCDKHPMGYGMHCVETALLNALYLQKH